MSDHERAYELFVGINPVPDPNKLRSDLVPAPAFFTTLEQRSTTMQTDQVRELPRIEPSPMSKKPRRRRLAAAAVAAFLIATLVGLGGWLAFGGSDDPNVIDSPIPTTGPYELPDFSSDVAHVGTALTAAQNTHDAEVFLSLFAQDAELRFGNQAVSPDDIRAGVTLEDAGSRFHYDRAWARIMNEEEVYSSCEVNGDRVICDLTSTSDHLKPVLSPIPDTAAVQIVDGKITLFVVVGVDDPSNVILSDFQDWTLENYPQEAGLMWSSPSFPSEVRNEESALLHLRLGEEYVSQR